MTASRPNGEQLLNQTVLRRVQQLRAEVRLSEARPNDGRCGNVAAALETEFGWERQWGYLKLLDTTVSWVHCWNRLADGTIIDATADQYQDLWLGDVVSIPPSNPFALHYLHDPRTWTLHWQRAPGGLPVGLHCESGSESVTVPFDEDSPAWRLTAATVLRLLTGWDLDERVIDLAARTLRASAASGDTTTTDDLIRPLVIESIQHLARSSESPWIAPEFREPVA